MSLFYINGFLEPHEAFHLDLVPQWRVVASFVACLRGFPWLGLGLASMANLGLGLVLMGLMVCFDDESWHSCSLSQ